MIDESVMSFVGSNCQEHLSHLGVLAQLPVFDGHCGRRKRLPHGESTGIQFLNEVRVGFDCFFLKVANKSERNRDV